MGDQAEIRRREATRAIIRYFLAGFVVVLLLGGMAAYAVVDAERQRHESYALRVEYCLELEKLKADNREEVARKKANYHRDLRLLGIKDSPELRRAAEAGWARTLRRNAARSCPYTAGGDL
jgi:hypothetical protein